MKASQISESGFRSRCPGDSGQKHSAVFRGSESHARQSDLSASGRWGPMAWFEIPL